MQSGGIMFKSKLMIILFGIVILFLPIITTFMPKKEFSQNENRILAANPNISISNYVDKSFMNDFELYISDHFFARERWIIIKNNIDIMMGKTEINGVITIDNHQMLEAWKSFDSIQINKNINWINQFADSHKNINVHIMLAPTAQGIFYDKLPGRYGLINQKEFIKDCYSKLNPIDSIEVYNTLFKNRDKYTYYRTDHHWTTFGAYLAYVEFCVDMGLTPYEVSDFVKEQASDNFRGTLYSKTLDTSIEPDVINYYKLKEAEPEVILNSKGEKPHIGLYYTEYLKEKDKYSSFIGSNTGLINLVSNINNNESLLVIKDSYAHSLLPFIAKHYQRITVLDLRYTNRKMLEEIDLNQFTNTIFIYNTMTFTQNNGFNLLEYIK